MSHNYLGQYTEDFRSNLDKIPNKGKQIVFSKMKQLLESEDPRQLVGVNKLKDKRFEGAYRIRAGNYRLLFHVYDQTVVHMEFEYRGEIQFIKIANRKDIYQ